MPRPSRTTLAALATAGILTLAACSGADATGADTTGPGTTTSDAASTGTTGAATSAAPDTASPDTAAAGTTAADTTAADTNAPGTAATGDAAPGSTAVADDPLQHNEADIEFARTMIVHHQGAVAMADLAQGRASDPRVLDLAARIRAAQAPEIDIMNGWLAAWGAPTSGATSTQGTGGTDMGGMDHSGMGHSGGTTDGGADGGTAVPDASAGDPSGGQAPGGDTSPMPGEMTPEQMQQLAAASGTEFDARWLELMIAHHRGAVPMAGRELEFGLNPDALDLARTIAQTQAVEIGEMEQMQATG